MILKNEINESSTTKNIAIEWLKLLQLNINRLARFLGGLIPTQVLTWSGSTVLGFKSVLQALSKQQRMDTISARNYSRSVKLYK